MTRAAPFTAIKWILLATCLTLAVLGIGLWGRWFPAANAWIDRSDRPSPAGSDAATHADHDHDHDDHDHADHDHSDHDHEAHDDHADDHDHADHDHADHEGHREETALTLSSQALRNVGLTRDWIRPIEPRTFQRSITVPAVVVERPGRTRVQVATPMTGVITHVHAVQGAAVQPGELLFQIRLTHEDLVLAQTEFVKTLGELEVEEREIRRLKEVTSSGAVAGKLLLEREYAKDKLSALLQAQQEALRLHGLSDEQVAQIARERRLLREMKVFAPSTDRHEDEEIQFARRLLHAAAFQPQGQVSQTQGQLSQPQGRVSQPEPQEVPLILRQLDVHKGQSVDAGETLCVLADYAELFIEGLAFEQDVNQLRNASANDWTVDAVFRQAGANAEVLQDLKIAYLANQVDTEARTLRFYVRLPNSVTKDRVVGDSRYVEWKYLPGQRLQLRVPVEQWANQIVLPVDAVAREGAESFVFQQNGDHFDRVAVHIKYRDQYAVVIDNDGTLKPGDRIAMRGAHQMQMALKNRSGGAVDPHAGHSH